MASRKLKFKPKPLVGGAVRRARDREDVPGIPETETNLSEKETTRPILSESCNENGAECKIDTLVTNQEDIDCSESNSLKRMKIENSSSGLLDSSKELVQPSVSDCSNHIDSFSSTPQRTLKDSSLSNITVEETKLPESSDSSSCRPIVSLDEDNTVKTPEVDVIPTSDVITKDSITSNNSSSKPDPIKAFSRFGRSRCKPVLSNPGLRKKTETIPTNYDKVLDPSSVRTESVIKSVQSELNKSMSIVDEITESFTSLESNEIEIHKLLVDSIDTPIVSSTKVPPSSFVNSEIKSNSVNNIGLKDVNSLTGSHHSDKPTETSSSEPTTRRSMVFKRSKTIEHKKSTSEKGQVNDNNPEILNTNIPLSPASNKVPISPIRATSKVLVPKPSPRISDSSTRRISFQGSDSEDEGKRKSLCLKSENVNVPTKERKEKVIKNNKRKRSQGSTYSKMGQETLEKFTKKFGKGEAPDKTKLTMIDLIFYNPKNNPMTVNPQQTTALRKKEEKLEVNESVDEALEEQSVDDVVPVPQLKVGPDGQVMLDPQSLVIETTGMEKSRAELEKSQVVQESGITRYSTYSKRRYQRTDWSPQETLQFYRALNTIGSDFGLMTKLFPRRTRHELKLKFKREEKTNLSLVDRAMTAPADFDFASLEEELKLENEEIERKALQKELDKESIKRERAIKKEEKLKNLGSKKKNTNKYPRIGAFKEFNDSDKGKSYIIKKKRKPVKRKSKLKTETLVDSDLEEELQIDLDLTEEEEEEEARMSLIEMVKETRSGRIPKLSTRLEEYEEINETLKKDLHRESDSEEDAYTPNGPEADMLFGSPQQAPVPESDERPWNIEITSLPTIEETVLLNDNVDDVSELSELGSFGQNETALDLSVPIRDNIQRVHLPDSDALLNRNMISQSIQIIDQLTAHVDNTSLYSDVTVQTDLPTDHIQDKIPLPSFESVSRSRPSLMYSLTSPPFVAADGPESEVTQENDRPNLVLANFYNDNDCILGE